MATEGRGTELASIYVSIGMAATVRYLVRMFERAHQILMMAPLSGPFGVL